MGAQKHCKQKISSTIPVRLWTNVWHYQKTLILGSPQPLVPALCTLSSLTEQSSVSWTDPSLSLRWSDSVQCLGCFDQLYTTFFALHWFNWFIHRFRAHHSTWMYLVLWGAAAGATSCHSSCRMELGYDRGKLYLRYLAFASLQHGWWGCSSHQGWTIAAWLEDFAEEGCR